MSLLGALIIGLVIGSGAGYLIKGNLDYLLFNTLTGIVGSIIGLAIYFFLLNPSGASFSLISWEGALCSVICALLLVLIVRLVHRVMPKRAALTTGLEEEDTKIDEDK